MTGSTNDEPDELYLPDEPYLYLASVKTRIANHFPLEQGDCDAWQICDSAQRAVLREEWKRQ